MFSCNMNANVSLSVVVRLVTTCIVPMAILSVPDQLISSGLSLLSAPLAWTCCLASSRLAPFLAFHPYLAYLVLSKDDLRSVKCHHGFGPGHPTTS